MSKVGNQLLDHLPPAELDRVLARARSVTFRTKQDVYRLNEPAAPVYFPQTAVLSLALPMGDGRRLDVGLVDHEGLLGMPAALGLESNLLQASTQVPGDCLRVAPAAFGTLLRECPSLASLTNRFIGFAWRSACQNAACGLAHPVEPRMCRWLLMVQDRTRSDQFPLSQEQLSQMLGVSRPTVTVTAGALQAAGLITYRRARVQIVDRKGLERTSCECYHALRNTYYQVMGFPLPAPPGEKATKGPGCGTPGE